MASFHHLVTACSGAFLTHLWSSTLWLVAALAAGLLMPRLAARPRYALLLLGVAKFAIPSAAITALLGAIIPARPLPNIPALTFLTTFRLAPPSASTASFGWMEALAIAWAAITA